MNRVFDLDVLAGPGCGGQMKVIAQIEDPVIARRIVTSTVMCALVCAKMRLTFLTCHDADPHPELRRVRLPETAVHAQREPGEATRVPIDRPHPEDPLARRDDMVQAGLRGILRVSRNTHSWVPAS